MSRAAATMWRTLIWCLVAAGVAVLLIVLVVPRVAGATPYAVMTGSMRPDYPPGSLVVVKPVDAEQLRVGDVITYQLESGDATVVTHRVVETAINLKGDRVIRTQGDANDVADQEPVRPVQIKGRLWYSVPYLGRVTNLMSGQQRQFLLYGVVTALLGYAAFMFTTAGRDRRRRKVKGKDSTKEAEVTVE